MPPVPSSWVEWVVLALTTGGVGKFGYDLFFGRNARRKDKADGDAVLIASAQNLAQQATESATKANDATAQALEELNTYRREQNQRWERLDAQLRAHSRWDRDTRDRLEELSGAEVPAPPPLFID